MEGFRLHLLSIWRGGLYRTLSVKINIFSHRDYIKPYFTWNWNRTPTNLSKTAHYTKICTWQNQFWL